MQENLFMIPRPTSWLSITVRTATGFKTMSLHGDATLEEMNALGEAIQNSGYAKTVILCATEGGVPRVKASWAKVTQEKNPKIVVRKDGRE